LKNFFEKIEKLLKRKWKTSKQKPRKNHGTIYQL